MAQNDFLPVTDDRPKKSVKKQIIWASVITLFIGFWALVLIASFPDYDNNFRYAKGSTIIMLISVGITFFLTLGMLLLKSIEWKEPEKCERTLHYFYLAILVLSIVGIFSGILGLIA
jgi:magnesium-transporting ATPase (P-type)